MSLEMSFSVTIFAEDGYEIWNMKR